MLKEFISYSFPCSNLIPRQNKMLIEIVIKYMATSSDAIQPNLQAKRSVQAAYGPHKCNQLKRKHFD